MQKLFRPGLMACLLLIAMPAFAQKHKSKRQSKHTAAVPAPPVHAVPADSPRVVIPLESSLHADLKKRKKVVIVPAPPPPPGPDPIPPKRNP